jgi:hypothetical protein
MYALYHAIATVLQLPLSVRIRDEIIARGTARPQNFGRTQIMIGNQIDGWRCTQRKWLTELYAQYSSAIFLLKEKDDPSPADESN